MDTVKYWYVGKVHSRYNIKMKLIKNRYIKKTPHQLSETLYKKKNFALLLNYNPRKRKSLENPMIPALDHMVRESYSRYTMYLRNKKNAYIHKGV